MRTLFLLGAFGSGLLLGCVTTEAEAPAPAAERPQSASEAPQPTTPVDASIAPPAVTDDEPLAELAWLSGSWGHVFEGGYWEEHWTEPRGGTMVGMSRMVRGDRTVFTEAIRIAARPDGIVYVVKPSNQPEAVFHLSESRPGRVLFTNPTHRTPHTIAYEIQPDGSLLAWIENERDGQNTREHFPKQRARLRGDR